MPGTNEVSAAAHVLDRAHAYPPPADYPSGYQGGGGYEPVVHRMEGGAPQYSHSLAYPPGGRRLSVEGVSYGGGFMAAPRYAQPVAFEQESRPPRHIRDIMGPEPASVLDYIGGGANTVPYVASGPSYITPAPAVYRSEVMMEERPFFADATPRGFSGQAGESRIEYNNQQMAVERTKLPAREYMPYSPANPGTTSHTCTYSEDLPRYIPSMVSAVSGIAGGGTLFAGTLFDGGPTWTEQLAAQARALRPPGMPEPNYRSAPPPH